MNREKLLIETIRVASISDVEAVRIAEELSQTSRCLAAAYMGSPELAATELILSSVFAWPTDAMSYEIAPTIIQNASNPERIIRGIGVWATDSCIMSSER